MTVYWTQVGLICHVLLITYVFTRVLLRPHREPTSRLAWMIVIATLPILGVVFYFLLGETNIGIKRSIRMREIQTQNFIGLADQTQVPFNQLPERYQHLFNMGQSANGFAPVGGNQAAIMESSEATIDQMVTDIDQAQSHVHILFYIWLTDHSGGQIVEALIRAAQRGVTCRVLVDALGSRAMTHSKHWKRMHAAGIHLASALPISHPLIRMVFGRLDLRNHRKIVIIDQAITFCGSQNCADAAFAVKAKFAPWVDMVLRFTGPIVRQNQQLFASDWQAATGEQLSDLIHSFPLDPVISHQCPAQVIGTGPTVRNAAMSDVFLALITSAWHELTITTPYFVPNEALHSALCAAARCGVRVNLILPQRNDSWVVAAASRSYYLDLLRAGVHIYEYVGGLLHTKSLTVDGQISLVGSANMDRRSFDLNYENNILFYDADLTQAIMKRQQHYIDSSVPVTVQQVKAWSKPKQLWNNLLAIMGPIL